VISLIRSFADELELMSPIVRSTPREGADASTNRSAIERVEKRVREGPDAAPATGDAVGFAARDLNAHQRRHHGSGRDPGIPIFDEHY
jgi:hypothetical protein